MISKFELKGEWFLPSKREESVSGVLVFDPTHGAELELFGNFENSRLFSFPKNEEIILGIMDNSKKVTLVNCMCTKIGGCTVTVGEEIGTPSTKYSIEKVLIGSNIGKTEDLMFNRISVEIHNLDEWVGINGFSLELDAKSFKNKEVGVKYKLPQPIEFQIDDDFKGYIQFQADTPSINRCQKSMSITQKVLLQIEAKKDVELETLFRYVFKFQCFLVLAVNKRVFLQNIYLNGSKHIRKINGGNVYPKDVELYFRGPFSDYSDEAKLDYDMISPYNLIKSDFPEIIKNWYKNYELLEPALNLLMEQFKDDAFSENSFLNLAQAAETFHLRTSNHKKMSDSEYKIMKKSILDSAPIEYHDWLNSQFSFGNHLDLHTRLSELIDKYSNKIVDKIVGDKEKFIKQVKDSRNFYTHYSPELEKKAVKGVALFYLTEKLKGLLICAFLMESGIKKDNLEKMLNRVKGRFVSHLTSFRQEE